jgi:hypothetical protein
MRVCRIPFYGIMETGCMATTAAEAGATGATFELRYADDFSSGALNTGLWGNPFGGGLYWNGAFSWSAGDVAVQNGQLVVSSTRHADGHWTAGGLNMLLKGNSITYGRVEFDARFEKGQGTGAAILLWPTSNDIWPPEIDMIEVPRGNRDQINFTNHWPGPAGENLAQSISVSLDASQWHHYQLDWTPDALEFFIDGVLSVRLTQNITGIPMSFGVMGHVAADFEAWYGGAPDATTPSKVSTYIDNVRISQWLYGSNPPPAPPPPPPPKEIGTGPDRLVLKISQDAYKGDAQYTVSVDGVQIGEVQTAAAWHSAGQSDTLVVRGNWATGPHSVTIRFLNDVWDGTSDTDRNLYIDGATYNGLAVAGAAQPILSGQTPGRFTLTDLAVIPGEAPPVRYGSPGAWVATADVSVAHRSLDGADYLGFSANPDWGTLPAVRLGPAAWQPAWNTHLAFDNFVQASIDTRAAGATGLDLMLLGARFGTVLLGNGSDRLTWVAQSNGTAQNQMTINTGGGDDAVRITAAGLSTLDAGHGPLYGAAYDGGLSTAVVRLGAGQDSIVTEGMVKLIAYAGTGQAIIKGGANADVIHAESGSGVFTGGGGRDFFVFTQGDGPVVITDFTPGTDRLRFVGIAAADLHRAADVQDGVAGLRITYDAAGDSVFLAHVIALRAGDMVFA